MEFSNFADLFAALFYQFYVQLTGIECSCTYTYPLLSNRQHEINDPAMRRPAEKELSYFSAGEHFSLVLSFLLVFCGRSSCLFHSQVQNRNSTLSLQPIPTMEEIPSGFRSPDRHRWVYMTLSRTVRDISDLYILFVGPSFLGPMCACVSHLRRAR